VPMEPAAPTCLRAGPALVGWAGLVLAGTAALVMLGQGPLSGPPVDPSQWLAWVQVRSPLVVTAAILRLVALAGSWYLILASAAAVAAGLTRSVRATRFVDVIALPGLRPVLQAILGASLAGTVALSATPAVAAPPASRLGSIASEAPLSPDSVEPDLAPDPPPVRERPSARSRLHLGPALWRLDPEPERGSVRCERAAPPVGSDDLMAPSGAPSLVDAGEHLDDAPATRHPGPSGPGAPLVVGGESTGSHAVDPSRAIAEAGDSHVVRAGESLWSIAYDVVAQSLKRAPTDGDVALYWHTLVDAHRPLLVDPDDPDLIFPGEVVRLPPVAPAAAGAERR
jgi:nucleoid-associated protein YgaU